MAILNSAMFNGARKQTGGFVLYTRKGETIARMRATQVSNPRTPIQMQQRVLLSNLVAFYRANSGWMKDAFESKRKNASDYNAFVSANLSTSQVALAKSDVDAGAAVVAPYKITQGSLGVIEMQLNGTDLSSNLIVGSLTIDENTTIGALSQALIANNNGIVEGMQLSLIINLQLAAAGSGVPYINVREHELIINSQSSELLNTFIPDGILEVVGTTTRTLGVSVATLGDGAATFILSQTRGGKTYVSTQSLVFFGSNAVFRQYTSVAQINAAIASYGVGTDSFLSSLSAAGSQSVATTLALMGISINNVEYLNGARTRALIAAANNLSFAFNRTLPVDAVVSAYYTIGTQATRYDLTSVAVAANNRGITATIGSTTLPTYSDRVTFVAVVDGDEFPISVTMPDNNDSDE